jgi:hypothetical protein
VSGGRSRSCAFLQRRLGSRSHGDSGGRGTVRGGYHGAEPRGESRCRATSPRPPRRSSASSRCAQAAVIQYDRFERGERQCARLHNVAFVVARDGPDRGLSSASESGLPTRSEPSVKCLGEPESRHPMVLLDSQRLFGRKRHWAVFTASGGKDHISVDTFGSVERPS